MHLSLRPAGPYRALTGVRALAAWWVVVYHFREYLPAGTPRLVVDVADHGSLAVDLFFVLSGYVIGANYAPLFKDGAGRRGYLVFLALRLSRIYPLHCLVLLLFLGLAIGLGLRSAHPPWHELDWTYLLLSLGLVQSWDIEKTAAWNVPAWSVSTEWLAYIAFPVLIRATAGHLKGVARQMAALLAGALAFAATSFLADAPGLTWMHPSYCLFRCLGEFWFGTVVSALAVSLTTHRARWSCSAVLVLPVVVQLAFGWPDYAGVPALFCGVVLLLSSDEQRWSGVLRQTWLQWLGEASYATYISHYLVKSVTKLLLVRPGVTTGVIFPAYCAFVLLATGLLFVFVERPSQAYLRKVIKRRVAVADRSRSVEASP